MTMTSGEWLDYCLANGYIGGDLLPDGRGVFIEQMTFGQAWIGIGDTGSVFERYTYSSVPAAIGALGDWQRRNFKDEPTGWHRHQPSDRRRTDGDPATEYIAP